MEVRNLPYPFLPGQPLKSSFGGEPAIYCHQSTNFISPCYIINDKFVLLGVNNVVKKEILLTLSKKFQVLFLSN